MISKIYKPFCLWCACTLLFCKSDSVQWNIWRYPVSIVIVPGQWAHKWRHFRDKMADRAEWSLMTVCLHMRCRMRGCYVHSWANSQSKETPFNTIILRVLNNDNRYGLNIGSYDQNLIKPPVKITLESTFCLISCLCLYKWCYSADLFYPVLFYSVL
jgi:hypothetical protein